MAAGEVTGATEEEVEEMADEYIDTPLCYNHDIPFERAYCLARIGKQPDEYDGPERFCQKRVGKLTEEEWADRWGDDYDNRDIRSFAKTCEYHGRKIDGHVENLESLTAAITHGLHAEDEHLQMDFDDAEQILYDGITEQWPEAYGWPPESEDPARYEMLDMVATNVVRRHRCEDYIDEEGEVRITDRISDEGVVVEPDGQHDENPIASNYRLLIKEITGLLKELGLTPKERAKMGSQEQSANALEAIGDAVSEAVLGDDHEYDPDQFEDSKDESAT